MSYVDIAARLGLDPDCRAAVVAKMSARCDRLYDDPTPLCALEDFFLRVTVVVSELGFGHDREPLTLKSIPCYIRVLRLKLVRFNT